MVLFMILLLTALALVVFTVLAVSAGGAVFIVLFSDVIVCVFILAWLMKKIAKKK